MILQKAKVHVRNADAQKTKSDTKQKVTSANVEDKYYFQNKKKHEKSQYHQTIVKYGFDIYKIPYSTEYYIQFKQLDYYKQEEIRKKIGKRFE